MIEVQRYGINGHYLHQHVEGIGEDCEIKEYGVGFQDGEYGKFGLVLYPYGYNHAQQTLLVINIKGKWIPTTTQPEGSGGIKLTLGTDGNAKDRAGDVWATFTTTGWVTCDYHYCGKQVTSGWEKGKIGEPGGASHYCSEHVEVQEAN